MATKTDTRTHLVTGMDMIATRVSTTVMKITDIIMATIMVMVMHMPPRISAWPLPSALP